MSSDVIVAVVSGAFTLIGSFAGVLTSARLTNYRLEQLEKRVDKHNTLVERMARVETQVSKLERSTYGKTEK